MYQLRLWTHRPRSASTWMRNCKGKSREATGSVSAESLEDECLDTKVVGTLWKSLERSHSSYGACSPQITPQSRTGKPCDIS